MGVQMNQERRVQAKRCKMPCENHTRDSVQQGDASEEQNQRSLGKKAFRRLVGVKLQYCNKWHLKNVKEIYKLCDLYT